MQPTPLLKDGIRITPYDGTTLHAAPRFLLECEGRYFLISTETRALILALLKLPSCDKELEQAYITEGGTALPAYRLRELSKENLPSALLRATPAVPRRLPFIFSIILLPPTLTTNISRCLAWLFEPMLTVLLMAGFTLLHIATLPTAISAVHGGWLAADTPQLIALLLLSGLAHELGHVSACRYFGCQHGGIGFGLYLIFPAWFADVTHAWRLTRKRRAVVDLGGVYFQAILLIGVDAWALTSGSQFALQLVWLITLTMLFTLNPMFKFDGYWLLSDLSGLHNLHQQMRVHAARLLGRILGRPQQDRPAGTVHNWILHLYVLLGGAYFLFFGSFLLRELLQLGDSLPLQLRQTCKELEHSTDLLPPLLHLLRDLLWPTVLLLACTFFFKKMLRALSGLAAAFKATQQGT